MCFESLDITEETLDYFEFIIDLEKKKDPATNRFYAKNKKRSIAKLLIGMFTKILSWETIRLHKKDNLKSSNNDLFFIVFIFVHALLNYPKKINVTYREIVDVFLDITKEYAVLYKIIYEKWLEISSGCDQKDKNNIDIFFGSLLNIEYFRNIATDWRSPRQCLTDKYNTRSFEVYNYQNWFSKSLCSYRMFIVNLFSNMLNNQSVDNNFDKEIWSLFFIRLERELKDRKAINKFMKWLESRLWSKSMSFVFNVDYFYFLELDGFRCSGKRILPKLWLRIFHSENIANEVLAYIFEDYLDILMKMLGLKIEKTRKS